jgi:(1->4)-alpha-D-glucan 1-alpha-D-glucosylmutase
VQLHAGFGFYDAAQIADYLAELGVSHLYCSPYLQAAPGSTHGYDVVDPDHFSVELGGAPGHAEMVGALRSAGLGQVLDIVPNHMAAVPANRWWWDVLENGPASRYAPIFDIDWEGPDERYAFRVLEPVLGDHYGRVLEANQLAIRRRGGAFVVRYLNTELPVSPDTLGDLIGAAARRAGSGRLAELGDDFASLAPARLASERTARRRHERTVRLVETLESLCADTTIAAAVDAEVDDVNGDADRLDALLRRQHYRLAHWRAASEELDYRRFFNIASLIGVRVEDPAVFARTHRLVMDLVRERVVDGLRIDHVDGLRDPQGYLAALAEQTDGVYTVVEKILEPGETLPGSWPVAGTSGYDFLNRVNNLFVAEDNQQAMTDCYEAASGETASYEQVVHDAKQQVMQDELAAEVEHLTRLIADLSDRYRRHRDYTRREVRTALRELIACFPVYRTYVRAGKPPAETDVTNVHAAVRAAVGLRPDIDAELVGFLGELVLGQHEGAAEREFCQRFAQLTGPVMAKGAEDTAFYRYHRLISLNEVGGRPDVFGRSVAAFHGDTAVAAAEWPDSMLTLSTHDTKRSADVRARLNVLAEIPGPWRRAVERWSEITDPHRHDGWPDPNALYLLFQTVVGAWPIDADRLAVFMAKATKEAKVYTSWVDPTATYDQAVEAFVRAVLADDRFVRSVEGFLADQRIVARGRRNSLAQTALLLTCPGVPDLYQGGELWDLSLVDPDNRRPVDYALRRRVMSAGRNSYPGRAEDDHLGASKLWLSHRLLTHRRDQSRLYKTPDYEPLPFHGLRAGDAVGFARGPLVTVVPRLGTDEWAGTSVDLPGRQWTDVLTGAHRSGDRQLLCELLGTFPVAVLVRAGA